ncbi:Ribonuclease H-like superfamily, partial [Sesbania bispinosa]
IRTSAYHPSANGKAERWIKALKEHLAMLVQNDPKEWPNYLPFITQAYRNLPHSAHGFSPYEVMFGARMRTPLDMVRGSPPEFQPMVKQYPYWVQHTMDLIHRAVREISLKAAERMKMYYDKFSTIIPFNFISMT